MKFLENVKDFYEMLFGSKKQLKGYVNVFFSPFSENGLLLSPQPFKSLKKAKEDVENYSIEFQEMFVGVIDLSKVPENAILWEK